MSTVRIRIQNNGDEPVQGFQIRYHVSHPVADLAHPEVYYPAGVAGQWLSEGEGQSVMVLDFPGLVIQPGSIYPDNAGLSIGLHAVNWGPWNKSDDYSQPAGATFLPTDRIEVFSEGKLLSGPGTSVLPGCPIVEFLKIQGDSLTLSVLQNEEALQANLEVRSARDTQLLPSELFGSTPGMPDTLSIAFPVQQRTQGEVWVACQGQMLAYFAFGAMPDLALQATESGLWDSPAAYVATNNTAFGNEGLLSGDRFVRKAGLSGRSSADWMLYRFWQDSSETALPIPRFPAQGVVLLNESNSDSLSFEWEAIANAESYALRVVRDSVYGDTVISTAVTENKVRIPMMTEGNYVWWAEPQFKMGLGVVLPGFTNTFRNVNPLIKIPTTVPVPPGGPAPTISVPTISPWTRLPVGTFVIHDQGLSDVPYDTVLDVPSIAARKDTRMLDLKNNHLDLWDIPHVRPDGTFFSKRDEEENYRCWAAAAQMLNRHFKGTLSQDEIKFHIKAWGAPENHFPHGSFGAAGVVETFNAMAYALNLPGFMGNEIAFLNNLSPMDLMNPLAVVGHVTSPLTWGRMGVPDGWTAGGPSAEDILVNIRIGTPLAIAQINGGFDGMHMMVINGVRLLENGRVYAHFLNTDNNGGDEWRYIGVLKDLKNMQDVIGLIGENMNLPSQVLIELRDLLVTKFFDQPYYFAYFTPPASVSPRNMDPRLLPENDYDHDGLLTFDEEVRFGTDPHNPDSDFDGVQDKEEIGYYVGQGALADRDGDGLRAELDPDADGDGDCDGDENTNGDYYYLHETNAMDPAMAHPDSERRCRSAPVALLALDNLSMNDRAVCLYNSPVPGLENHCPVASLGLRSSVAVQLGVESHVGHVLAGSAVWLRSRAQVHGNLWASEGVTRQDETPVVSGSVEEFDSGVAPLLLPYQNIGLPELAYLGTVQTYQVPSGKTAFLKPGGARKNVVVSSGATLILMPGSYDFGSLDVQSGGVVQILSIGVLFGSVDITLAGTLGWNGTFQGDEERFAQRFKVTVQGDETIFLNGSFAGHLTAPRAHVVLGQAAKEHAGQIAARRITVHQGARFRWVQGN